ncbi:hypothetical protein [Roseicella aquatilis]|uniref:Uncharacterized protein n=1 Tax=Roseicella aquatilis TaxID=2527868 RepID=A0A4R4D3G4_9PROT|nr:hypothetical protein [Roseicella aquatilis]TCZ52979.1 hypothetical protein EXY23_25490 [Roseicella aquatilis]
MRLFARAFGFGLLIFATVLPLGAGLLLVASSGPDGIVALGPAGWASLVAGLVLPSCAALLVQAWLTQRAELATLRDALLRQGATADSRHLALQALVAESREHTAILQEQTRLMLGQLSVGKRIADTQQALMTETRLQRLVGEWDMTGRELAAVMAAMWRLVFGWRTAEGPEGQPSVELPLPSGPELGLAILRLLPATAEDMAKFEVDERFVRQAAHYRAVFRTFLDRVPETGPINRGLFLDMVQGRVDARLALLPRPNHALVIPPETLAAE